MTDLDGFERRLASAVVADADEALPVVDPAVVARAAIARGRRSRLRLRLVFELARGLRLAAAAAAVLAIAILAWEAGLRGLWVGVPNASPEMSSPALGTVPLATPSGSWTHAGSMAEARSNGLVAIVLLDGRVLVAGGARDLRSAEVYHPDSQTWTVTGRMVEPRLYSTAVLLRDGRVLLAGGTSDRGAPAVGDVVTFAPTLASAEVYDPRTGTWTRTGTMAQARSGHTATLLPDGRVLVAGGAAPETVPYPRFSSTEIYDPASGTWTDGPPMLRARDSHSATLLPSGMVLVAGGHARDRLGSAELYDPGAGAWVETAALPEAFGGHGATLLANGAVLVFGGDVPRGPGAVASAHAALYDPVSDSWAMTASMLTPRIGHGAAMLADGDLLVTGGGPLGAPDPNPFDSAEIYDATAGTWTESAPMSFPRSNHAIVLLADGRVLVIGGSTRGGVSLASAELFEP
jgi:hypothetical protein